MRSVAARPRIKDVAEYAGVSPKTVSNVINDFEHVSDRTREAVKEAIDALGYRVNIAGRQLRRGRIGMITLAVPELDVAYFAELATHVMAEAEKRGQTVLLHRTGGAREQELAVLGGFDARISDGVILSPLALHPRDLAGRDQGLPVVLLGERPTEGGADHVAVDNVRAAREATAHLLSRGRRRIAVVGGTTRGRQGTDRLRTDGCREALKAAGVPFDAELVVPVDAYHREHGARAAAALMDRRHRPDALLCLNDDLALGALRALHERQVDVPGDLDVVGFDDIEAARYSVPSLTTVSPDKAEIARAAVTLLLDRIEDPATGPPQDHVVGHEVIVRESSGG
ncbi:LacI family transcriptional regulator [Streptomyces triticagri]|uniref:LacI family transcriptional regulator n=1 Tax=Streptomyces triticagri TaxID=2293568 RepID=A0A372LVG3_9ACTN|nr:LacI family DNA-binding transcriptional regulator [Streptomyces triticagri]RFU82658.1 LacI family transcriptional regulator [Streptomyces triticagri]